MGRSKHLDENVGAGGAAEFVRGSRRNDMRRRFRRNRGIWLPMVGRDLEDAPSTTVLENEIELTASDGRTGITGAVPILLDAPRERLDTNAFASIGDILTNEYFLNRIVGNVYVEVASQNFTIPGTPPIYPTIENYKVLVAIGFCVARVDDQNRGAPLGITSGDGINYQVDSVDNVRQPWIWRRTWILQPYWVKQYIDSLAQQGEPINSADTAPHNNWQEYGGSLRDGPQIDAKTKRRVHAEERTWMIITARSWPVGSAWGMAIPNTVVRVSADLRAFGSLRRAKNTGQFT